ACRPRTATTARPAELAASGGGPASPSRSPARDAAPPALRASAIFPTAGAAKAGGGAWGAPFEAPQVVRGEAALDQQVVEVTADRFSDAGQFTTSAGAVHRRPWASATGRQVTLPPYVFSPRRSAGSAASAARQPRLAISSAYGSVTLVSA